jgi:hypothetical protein
MVPVEEMANPFTEAVMMSAPAQPMSLYEAVATPATVTTLGVNAALPFVAHGEVKLTVNGVLVGAPPTLTVTLTAAVPNADSVPAGMLTGVMETLAVPSV